MNFYGQLGAESRMAAVCDVNQAARERAITKISKDKDYKPAEYSDMRKMFESKDIDAVSIVTPNHWHALATIWACQAGKDVYVEKPASHNIYESAQLVKAPASTTGWCRSGPKAGQWRTKCAPYNCCERESSGRFIMRAASASDADSRSPHAGPAGPAGY
jgi:hypothetical protein